MSSNTYGINDSRPAVKTNKTKSVKRHFSSKSSFFSNNSARHGDISASELSQYVSESVERDLVHTSLRKSKL